MNACSANPFSTRRSSASLEVHLLGLVDFESALVLQERLVYEISGRDDTQGALLLCEHPPIVTIGREGSRAHIGVEYRELTARRMDVRWLNRGGGCLVHAPGQLAAYPILPLDRLGLGIADYRRRLEEGVLDVCRELHVAAWRRADQPGLWCRLGQFAQVGAAVKQWTSYHGLFLNVAPSLDLMRLVYTNPACEPVTSLAAQRERVTEMHRVREALVRHLAQRLGYEQFHLYTGHPLLRRTKRKIYVDA
jgi:lipoate-protein ligase B